MRRSLFALLAALFLVPGFDAAWGAGQASRQRDCLDEAGVDRCDAAQRQRLLDRFGMRSIEAHRDAGDRVRRAFYVDGYGRDVVAIAFVRPRGGDPELWVHFPPTESGASVAPLRAAVTAAAWGGVVARSRHFDRALVPLPPPPPDPAVIHLCLHPWLYTVEATDPAEPDEAPIVRRGTENGCADGLVRAYADELQWAATPLLPQCDRLDPSQYRYEATRLAACGLLSGDRLAAAEARNNADAFLHVFGPLGDARLQPAFEHDAEVDWNGERNQGAGSARTFWASRMAGGLRTLFSFESIRGETPHRVRIIGVLTRWTEGEGEQAPLVERARVEQIWTRNPVGDLTITRAAVGPFETVAGR